MSSFHAHPTKTGQSLFKEVTLSYTARSGAVHPTWHYTNPNLQVDGIPFAVGPMHAKFRRDGYRIGVRVSIGLRRFVPPAGHHKDGTRQDQRIHVGMLVVEGGFEL
jgi:hypothetical protein